MKRLIGIFLTIAMVLGSVPRFTVSGFAAEESTAEDEVYIPVTIWELRDGEDVLIVQEDCGVAIAEPQLRNGEYGGYAYPWDVEIVDGKITNPPDEAIWEFDLVTEGKTDIIASFYRDGRALSKLTNDGPEYDPQDYWPIDISGQAFSMGGKNDTWEIRHSECTYRKYEITNVATECPITIFDINEIGSLGGIVACYVAFCGMTNGVTTYDDFTIYAKRDPSNPDDFPSFMKMKHTLNLESDISLRLWFEKELIKRNCIDQEFVFLEYTITNSVGGNIIQREDYIWDWDLEEYGDYFIYTISGLTAVDINAEIEMKLFGCTYDAASEFGDYEVLCTDVYSIATYAYSQLNKPETPAELKTVCADLLRYGAKAQIYKSYNAEELADANMTEVHKSYLSDLDRVSFGNTDQILDDLADAPITWAGKSLNLESKVALKFVFDPSAYEGDVSVLTMKVSYKDIKGAEKTATVAAPELYNEEKGLYAFTFGGLLATELRSVVSVQIFAGDEPVSATLQYSADTYGNDRTGDLLELCKALFAYSDSAKAYFVG